MSARAFMTGIAALFLATGTAHATNKLPSNSPLLGDWCWINDVRYNMELTRCTADNEGDLTQMTINPDGNETHSSGCTYSKVEREGGRYRLHASCDRSTGPAISFEEDWELWIVGKTLHIHRR